jgi:hypothetical protein
MLDESRQIKKLKISSPPPKSWGAGNMQHQNLVASESKLRTRHLTMTSLFTPTPELHLVLIPTCLVVLPAQPSGVEVKGNPPMELPEVYVPDFPETSQTAA